MADVVTKTVVLHCDRERAFTLFTEHASEWWPSDRRHTKDAASTIHIERSGRFFERATDGSVSELGVVREFDRPARLVFDWYPGTGPLNPTQVIVNFEPVESGTLVTVIHGPGAAGDELYAQNVHKYAPSWEKVLGAFGEFARTS